MWVMSADANRIGAGCLFWEVEWVLVNSGVTNGLGRGEEKGRICRRKRTRGKLF